MFLRRILPVLVAVLALNSVCYAQQPEAGHQEQTRPGLGGPDAGRRHGRMGRRTRIDGMRELNLTEEQRQQQRAILQRQLGNTKAKREELFKLREKRIAGTFTAEDEARARALRDEIHNSMKNIRSEMENVLTAEQRAKLEQLKTGRKARREEMRERRREIRERREIPQS
jgi:Spy/CpxP family protein refolding chaperone